jgi:tetratricopeptide (TPR) repeat protein/O-antigen ligase
VTIVVLLAATLPLWRATGGRAVTGLGLLTMATLAAVMAWERWRRARRPRLPRNVPALLAVIAVEACAFLITVDSVHDLPRVTSLGSVFSVNLSPFLILVYGAFLVSSVWGTAGDDPIRGAVWMGVTAIVTFGAVNGHLFLLEGSRGSLMAAIVLITASLAVLELDRPTMLDLAVLAFAAVGLAATVVSPYPHQSLSVWVRLLTWMVVFFLVAGSVRSLDRVDRLLTTLLAVAAVVAAAAAAGVVAYASKMGWETALRARLGLRVLHANGLATYGAAMITLAASLAGTWSGPRRWLAIGAAALLLPPTVLTYSRSAAAGLLAGLLTLLLLRLTRPRRKVGWWWVMVLAPAAMLMLAWSLRAESGELTRRAATWRLTVDVIGHRPLLGVGFGNHLIPAMVRVPVAGIVEAGGLAPIRESLLNEWRVGWHPHNLGLEIAESTGVLGVAALAAVILAACVGIRRLRRPSVAQEIRSRTEAASAGVVALLVPHVLVLTLSTGTVLPLCFFVLLGVINGVQRIAAADAPETASRQPHHSGSGAIWAAACVFIAALLFVVRPLASQSMGAPGKQAAPGAGDAGREDRLRHAGRLNPLDAEIQAALGDISAGEKALAHYAAAVSRRNLYAPYHSRIGWLLWREGRLDDAIGAFRRSVELDPFGMDGEVPQADLGAALAAAGDEEGALGAFADALFLDPAALRGPEWRIAQGDIMLSGALPRFARTGLVDTELLQLIDSHLGRTGQPSTAVSVAEGGISLTMVADRLLSRAERTGDSALMRYVLSNLVAAYRRWDEPQRALDALERLERLTERNSVAHGKLMGRRATALLMLGAVEAAETELGHALLLWDDPWLHHQLGMLMCSERRYAEAIPHLARAAAAWRPNAFFEPLWPVYWRDLALACRESGRFDQAAAALANAHFLNMPSLAYAGQLLELGDTCGAHGALDCALDAYATAARTLILARQPRGARGVSLDAVAVGAARAYRDQGRDPSAAIADQKARLGLRSRQSRAYLSLVQQELAGE